MQRKGAAVFLLDILLGVLTVALIGAAVFAVGSFRDSLDLAYDADSFYYRLSDGDYGSMVEMYYTNEGLGTRADEELRQYYAIAEYYEAAVWYKAYEGEEAAERYLAEMESARARMGELGFVAEDIRAALDMA